jgi:coenzyme F420-0:L-glutamate ligase/coenzyme F420-1:gamma-L-glutamate ligase
MGSNRDENSVPKVTIIGITGIPMINKNDDLGEIVCKAAQRQGTPIEDGDIIVIAQKIVSKSEGRIVALKNVQPSELAKTMSRRSKKSAQLIELILRESKSIVRMVNGHLITETKQGWTCANSGIDVSNVSGGSHAVLLPEDSDESAYRIRKRIKSLTDRSVAIIISDTSGRPLRDGHIDVAIGSSGIDPLLDLRGEKDLFGYTLRVKKTAIVDELASAAELVIGQARGKIPVAIVRGYSYRPSETAKSTALLRPKEKELFL